MCRTPETSAATGSVASQLITHLGAGVRNRHCYQGRLLSRSPIHYAVFFSGSFGDGIEMVQALDEAHAVDIVLAQHPDAHLKAVPADSIAGMNKPRLLFSWLETL